jgi:hypothetical protein
MGDKSDLIPYLVVWAAAVILIIRQTWKGAGAGLMLAYCTQMIMLYWVGAAIHALPWSDLPETDLVYLGFQQATYAMLAFALGSVVLGPALANGVMKRKLSRVIPDQRLPRAYILYGIASYFVLMPTLGGIKGFSAIVAVGSQLVVVGCCLNCWKAWSNGGRTALFRSLAPTLLIPCVTVVIQGFLGFGVMAISIITVFCAQFFRPRTILVVGFAVSCYLGLTVYVTYMKGREALRTTVWDPESTISDKVDKFVETAKGFELFDPLDEDQLELIDGRLNQNDLVGASVDYLGSNDAYAKGETLVDAVIAMVPRVIWPDKPIEAGSGFLVTQFTGRLFASGTSVGVGPVMELYGNFGTPAVVIGFVLLGMVIKVIDVMAGLHLAMGNWYGFATWCLVGISFLNVGGSFVEVSMGAVASLLLAKLVNHLLTRFHKKASHDPIPRDAQLAGA